MASSSTYGDRFLKYWAKIKYIGPDDPPDRNQVGEMILDSQWLTVQDIFSFIGLPNKLEYEICFNNERALRSFLDSLSSNQDKWKNFEHFSPINFEVKNIFVKFWTGRIMDADIELYLSRSCEILKPVVKPLDNMGLWYGVRKYQVKMKRDVHGNLLTIPNSISLGPYNGKITYQGQIPACFICQSSNHHAKDCETVKCWKCGILGHKSANCTNTAMCSLCGANGHSFFNCPQSYTNKVKSRQQQKPEVSEDPSQVRTNQREERARPQNKEPAQPATGSEADPEQRRGNDGMLNPHSSAESRSTGSASDSEESDGTISGVDPSNSAGEESNESATEEDFSADSISPVTKQEKEHRKKFQKKKTQKKTSEVNETVMFLPNEGKRKRFSYEDTEESSSSVLQGKVRKK